MNPRDKNMMTLRPIVIKSLKTSDRKSQQQQQNKDIVHIEVKMIRMTIDFISEIM